MFRPPVWFLSCIFSSLSIPMCARRLWASANGIYGVTAMSKAGAGILTTLRSRQIDCHHNEVPKQWCTFQIEDTGKTSHLLFAWLSDLVGHQRKPNFLSHLVCEEHSWAKSLYRNPCKIIVQERTPPLTKLECIWSSCVDIEIRNFSIITEIIASNK